MLKETNKITDYLRCSNCSGYLIPPISQCIQGHVLCDTCFDDKSICLKCGDCLLPVLNRIIGNIAKDLYFPCPFEENGCDTKFKWNEIKEHAMLCDFKNYKCPIDSAGICCWEGPANKMKIHTFDKHKESSLVAIDGTINDSLDILGSSRKVILISAHDTVFLLHVFGPISTNLFNMAVQIIGTREDAKEYNCNLEIQLADSDDFEDVIIFRSSIRPIQTDVFDLKKIARKLDINIKHSSITSCKINIVPVIGEHKSDESVLREFICGKCKKNMKPPFYIVNANFSCCSHCERSYYYYETHYKNEPLKLKYENTFIPCTFAALGCKKAFKGGNITEHNCKYCCCHLCTWEGKIIDLLDHVKEQHNDLLWKHGFLNVLITELLPMGNNSSQKVFITNSSGKIFLLTYTSSGSDMRYVVIQSFQKQFRYQYTMTIGNENQCLQSTEVCTDVGEDIRTIIADGRAISIPVKKLQYMTNNDAWFCKIIIESTI